jgi:hypothetical protein
MLLLLWITINLPGNLVSVTIFENKLEQNFEGNTSVKNFSSAEKSNKPKFRELIKEASKPKENPDSNIDVKVKSADKLQDSIDIKPLSNKQEESTILADEQINVSVELGNLVESTFLELDFVVSESIILPFPVVEQIASEGEVVSSEERANKEEDTEQVDNGFISDDFIITTEKNVDSESEGASVEPSNEIPSVIIPLDIPVIIKETFQVQSSNKLDNNKVIIPVIGDEKHAELIDLTKLTSEEQALHQNFKKIDLPKGFIPQTNFKQDDIKSIAEGSIKEVNKFITTGEKQGFSVKAESVPISKIVLQNEKPIILPTLNFTLAEITKQGSVVISKMIEVKESKESSVVPQANDDEIIIDTDQLLSDINSKNDNLNSKSSLGSYGAILEKTSDEIFSVTFKGQVPGLLRNDALKPEMQVSLAVKEILNTNSANTKQIIINLHPQTLGAVKVEILSQLGHDGASKIETIKITADKHDTLIMLEERRADLAKSLKEVSGAKEDANLQFEAKQDQGKGQQGAYFSTHEERDNWMSQFGGLVTESDIPPVITRIDEYATRGIANDEKVDLVA